MIVFIFSNKVEKRNVNKRITMGIVGVYHMNPEPPMVGKCMMFF